MAEDHELKRKGGRDIRDAEDVAVNQQVGRKGGEEIRGLTSLLGGIRYVALAKNITRAQRCGPNLISLTKRWLVLYKDTN